ncbi:hypothetical protein, partial [Moorena sp. SIO2C4]|uniref:hypothetical protein n=1 Tax=Moorena sp. SIO2C4 TaxID=2607824 RepID=UPI00257BCF6D
AYGMRYSLWLVSGRQPFPSRILLANGKQYRMSPIIPRNFDDPSLFPVPCSLKTQNFVPH